MVKYDNLICWKCGKSDYHTEGGQTREIIYRNGKKASSSDDIRTLPTIIRCDNCMVYMGETNNLNEERKPKFKIATKTDVESE